MRRLAAAVAVLGVFAGPGAASALADLSLSVAQPVVAEGGTMTITVTRTGLAPINAASVNVVTGNAGDTAVAPDDYTALTAPTPPAKTLSWNALETGAKTVQVPLAQDALDEDDELFTVALTGEAGDTVTARSRSVTIADDPADVPPTLTIADASVVEGTGTDSTLAFPLTLSAASGRTMTATFATADATATAGQDYTAKTGTVSIPAGATTGTIHVTVIADDIVEPNETLTMTLTNPVNVTLGTPAAGTGTITNDDTLPTLAVEGPEPTVEGSTGLTTPFTFAITLSKPSQTPIMVTYSTADGSASAPSDYTATEAAVSFAPGETRKTFTIPVIADTVEEGNENFSVTLSDTGTLTATVGGVTAIIVDDDGAFAPKKAAVPALDPAPVTRDTTPPALKLSKITSSRGIMRITVSCPVTEQVCRGTLTVFSVPARKSKVKSLRREIKLASSLFVIPGGKKAKLTLRPSKRVGKLIRQARTVRARAYAVARDSAGNVGTAQARGTVRAGG